MLDRILEKIISQKFIALVAGVGALFGAGQWELGSGVLAAFIAGKTIQNTVLGAKNGDTNGQASKKQKKAVLPNSGASEGVSTGNTTYSLDTQWSYTVPETNSSPLPDTTQLSENAVREQLVDAAEILDQISSNVMKDKTIPKNRKKWNIYELLLKEIGANASDTDDFGSMVRGLYYGKIAGMTNEIRLTHSKELHLTLLAPAREAYEEVFGVPAPASLSDMSKNWNLFWVELKPEIAKARGGACVGNVDGRYRMAYDRMKELYEHLEALNLMMQRGVDWEAMSPEADNPWGIANYALVKD